MRGSDLRAVDCMSGGPGLANPGRKTGDSATMPQLQGLVETRDQSTYKSLIPWTIQSWYNIRSIQLGLLYPEAKETKGEKKGEL